MLFYLLDHLYLLKILVFWEVFAWQIKVDNFDIGEFQLKVREIQS